MSRIDPSRQVSMIAARGHPSYKAKRVLNQKTIEEYEIEFSDIIPMWITEPNRDDNDETEAFDCTVGEEISSSTGHSAYAMQVTAPDDTIYRVHWEVKDGGLAAESFEIADKDGNQLLQGQGSWLSETD